MRSFFALLRSWFKKVVAFFTRKPVNDEPETKKTDPGEIVCYYGCPNSKKAKELQLNKKPL